MAIIESWYPPSRVNWALIVTVFKFFPLVGLLQWAVKWYGSGKTSVDSRLNVPGRIGWMTMECWGFISVLYCMYTIPTQLGLEDLPRENKIMAGLFTIHYIYRAIIGPLIAPSMSPIHIVIWVFAAIFQVVNGLSIGGWLAGYGPTTRSDWQDKDNYKVAGRMELGMMIFFLGFVGNIFHDDELREIRRAAIRNQKKRAAEADDSTGKVKDKKGSSDKIYVIPENGLFKYILYPHYLLEWIEWTGFWIMGGLNCVPARNFVLAEITTMSLRALQGRQWYVEKFGKEKVGNRKAFLPGLI